MKILIILILVKTYLESIAIIFPYNDIENSYILKPRKIDFILALNKTYTIVSRSDGRVYYCINFGKFKCDSIL